MKITNELIIDELSKAFNRKTGIANPCEKFPINVEIRLNSFIQFELEIYLRIAKKFKISLAMFPDGENIRLELYASKETIENSGNML